MTPNKFLFALVSVLMLVGVSAEAQFAVTPLDPGGYVPGPVQPMPPHPGQPGHGQRLEKVVHLGRYVTNDTLPLRQLAGLGREFQGYEVEAVRVATRPTGYYASFELLIDGRVTASAASNGANVALRPHGPTQLGWDVQSLRLRVQGTAYIDRLVIVLSAPGGVYPGPGPGPRPVPPHPGGPSQVTLPIHLNLQTSGANDHIDLGRFVNLSRYPGYRVQSIQIGGQPVHNNALVDVLLNGYPVGGVVLDYRGLGGTVYPQRPVVLGYGGDQLALMVRGRAVLTTVVLQLSR